MANISTSLAAFGKGLLSVGGAVGGALLQAAPAFAPLIASALAPRTRPTPVQYPSGMDPYGMPMLSTSFVPALGGAAAAAARFGIPALAGGAALLGMEGPLFGGAQVPGAFDPLRGPARLPRTIETKDAAGRTRVYVLAPTVTYGRVPIRTRRRCRSGGR